MLRAVVLTLLNVVGLASVAYAARLLGQFLRLQAREVAYARGGAWPES